MKIKTKKLAWLWVLAPLFWGCEDVIDVDLADSQPQLTIDAWLRVDGNQQNIRLTMTSEYFSNRSNDPFTGATVSVTNTSQNQTFSFQDQGDGNYRRSASDSADMGAVGDEFRLEVQADGQVFEAFSVVGRVPPIDSLIWEFREADAFSGPEGHYIEVFARDLVGPGDAYWFKTYRNDQFINDPSYINYAYDAAFAPGFEGSDGKIFIAPIRNVNLNYLDPEEPDLPPYQIGDRARVEIHSITNDARQFLIEVQEQTTNGGLFATPAYNITSNIQNVNENADVVALGYFCTSAVSEEEIIVGE